MIIETEWGVEQKVVLYKETGQIGRGWFGLFNMQKVVLILLVLIWLLLIIVNLTNSNLPRI